MHRLTTSFVLGYHGCSQETADSLLAGDAFALSANNYDWLGPGVYFWQSNPLRARSYALEKSERSGVAFRPAVVGAVIDLGLCLDLSSSAGVQQVVKAYESLKSTYERAGLSLPQNAGGSDRLKRRLDCAVIKTLHGIRKKDQELPVDTVSGVFIEGDPIYTDAGFYEKTHIQICVCNPACIRGVFRVSDTELG